MYVKMSFFSLLGNGNESCKVACISTVMPNRGSGLLYYRKEGCQRALEDVKDARAKYLLKRKKKVNAFLNALFFCLNLLLFSICMHFVYSFIVLLSTLLLFLIASGGRGGGKGVS